MNKTIRCRLLIVFLAVFLMTLADPSVAKDVIILRGDSIDSLDSFIFLSDGSIISSMDIKVASMQIAYDPQDFLVYDPSTEKAALYDESTLLGLPDLASLSEELKDAPFIILTIPEDYPTPGDADGDGVADEVDNCPHSCKHRPDG